MTTGRQAELFRRRSGSGKYKGDCGRTTAGEIFHADLGNVQSSGTRGR
jgi:hypothetical protein